MQEADRCNKMQKLTPDRSEMQRHRSSDSRNQTVKSLGLHVEALTCRDTHLLVIFEL